jgi:hypothetical protein
MKYFRLTLVLLIAIVILGAAVFMTREIKTGKIGLDQGVVPEDAEKLEQINNQTEKQMTISSSAFNNNSNIPAKYTCDGENINPPLQFDNVPESAHSLVLIVDDPDAASGTWVHWTVWNIDPKIKEIKGKSVPAGSVQGATSSGSFGYGGPCPPTGIHRYFFKLYALDAKIDLSSDAKVGDLMRTINGLIIDEAELIGLYSRQ